MRLPPSLTLSSASRTPRLAFGGAERPQAIAPASDTRIQRLLLQPALPPVVITQLWGRGSLQGVVSVCGILEKPDFRVTGAVRIGGESLDFCVERKNSGAIRLKLTEALPNPLAPKLSPTLAMALNAGGGFSASYVEMARKLDTPIPGHELPYARALADGLLQALVQAVQENRFYAAGEKPSGGALMLPPCSPHSERNQRLPSQWRPAETVKGLPIAALLQRGGLLPNVRATEREVLHPLCRPFDGRSGRLANQVQLTGAGGSVVALVQIEQAETLSFRREGQKNTDRY